ncbi:MAG: hypothetical protein F6K10_39070, partial [Moorea sp. SIO2B7]|nr:hypothetical protein [Moorena sp. SIO2B7]
MSAVSCQPSAVSRQLSAYLETRLPTPDSRFPTPDSRAKQYDSYIMAQAKARHPDWPDRFFNVGFIISPE